MNCSRLLSIAYAAGRADVAERQARTITSSFCVHVCVIVVRSSGEAVFLKTIWTLCPRSNAQRARIAAAMPATPSSNV